MNFLSSLPFKLSLPSSVCPLFHPEPIFDAEGKAGSFVDDKGHFYKPIQPGPRGDRERAFYEAVALELRAHEEARLNWQGIASPTSAASEAAGGSAGLASSPLAIEGFGPAQYGKMGLRRTALPSFRCDVEQVIAQSSAGSARSAGIEASEESG
jgi:hypothetical protein